VWVKSDPDLTHMFLDHRVEGRDPEVTCLEIKSFPAAQNSIRPYPQHSGAVGTHADKQTNPFDYIL
jgi:hypothetical protein